MDRANDMMSDQVEAVRAEAAEHLWQYRRLATHARNLVHEAVSTGYVPLATGDDALRRWGMEPLVKVWQVTGTATVSFGPLRFRDVDEVLADVPAQIATAWRHVLPPGAGVDPVQVVEAAAAGTAGPISGTRPYRVTAEVTVRLPAEATTAELAAARAVARIEGHYGDLGGFAPQPEPPVQWRATEPQLVGPEPPHPQGAAVPGAVMLPPAAPGTLEQQLTAETARRDRAAASLGTLRSRIRTTMITALGDGEIRNDPAGYQTVDQALQALDLPGLPRARHFQVRLDRRHTVGAATAQEAAHTAQEVNLQLHTSAQQHPMRCVETARTGEPVHLGGELWQVPYRERWSVWLREAASRQAAAGLVHSLSGAVVPDPDTVAVDDLGTVIDPHLDPDRD